MNRRKIKMHWTKWITVYVLVPAALVHACAIANAPVPPPPSEPVPMHTGHQLGLQPGCTHEGIPLAPECNELSVLPWCPHEDTRQDGRWNPPCFWVSPTTGLLWLDDGDEISD